MLCATATLAAVLGFAYGNLFGLERSFELEKWQSLLGTGLTVGLGLLAWFATRTTLRVNVYSREEDRLEERLPGLRRAADLVVPVASDLRRITAYHTAHTVLASALDVLSHPHFEAAVVHRLQGADPSLIREITGVLWTTYLSMLQLKAAHDELHRWRAAMTAEGISQHTRDSMQGYLASIEASHDQAKSAVISEIESVQRYALLINRRIVQAQDRLTHVRTTLDTFFDQEH